MDTKQLRELVSVVETLRNGLVNMRADLQADRFLVDALLMRQSLGERTATAQAFGSLSERWIAGFLANSRDPSDAALAAIQRSVEHAALRLASLPTQGHSAD